MTLTSRSAQQAERVATLLIVDDSRLTRELLRAGLARFGYEILTASDGGQAIEILNGTTKVDLIILDLVMPGMDGFEFLQWRSSNLDTSAIPVIVSSSLDDFGAITTALSMNCADYFTKPLSDRDMEVTLPLKIRNAVSSRRLMQQIRLQNDLLSRELEMAARYQKFLLPVDVQLKGVKVAYHFEPCSGVGGDYFDFFSLSRDRVGVVVADVSGHGVASAMTASIIKALLPGLFESLDSPQKALTALNDDLVRLTQADAFVTAFAGIIDTGRSQLHYAIGGHPHPVFCHKDDTVRLLGGPSNLLGVFDSRDADLELATETTAVARGDRLVLYTDGLTEAIDKMGNMLGTESLLQLVDKTRYCGIEEAQTRIWQEVRERVGENFSDDVAFIVMDF